MKPSGSITELFEFVGLMRCRRPASVGGSLTGVTRLAVAASTDLLTSLLKAPPSFLWTSSFLTTSRYSTKAPL